MTEMRERPGSAWALVGLGTFVILTVLTTAHVTDGLDAQIRQGLNPSGSWGETQLRAIRVTHWLRPTVLITLFGVVSLIVSSIRRSFRPSAYAALVAGATAICELGLKWTLPRIQQIGGWGGQGGSFPSGHVLCAVVCSGGVVLMLSVPPRWWHWLLAAVPPIVVILAVMISVLHSASDVVGGVLLGVFLLGASTFMLTSLRPAPPEPAPPGSRSDGARPARS